MIKHIGTHNERKIVILFRQVPGEDHMCLISYSDALPRMVHDEVMKTLESQIGQQSDNLADALFRQVMSDGRNCLEVLHKEGLMKKVQTSQVIVTPNASSKARLDEINNIMSQIKEGDSAIKRLSELDRNSGLVDPKANRDAKAAAAEQAIVDGVLSDEQLAANQIAQATKMRNDANALIIEATRLEQEASALLPKAAPTPKAKATAQKTVKTTAAPKKTTSSKAVKNDKLEKANKV